MGSDVSSLTRLLDRLNHRLKNEENGGVVVLESGNSPNLKTVLKNIVRAAITNVDGDENYQKILNDRAVCLSP
jgi:origin recognition complex subunit 3